MSSMARTHPRELSITERVKLDNYAMSNSQLNIYSNCPRQWMYRYRRSHKGEGITRPYFSFGTISHEFAEAAVRNKGKDMDNLHDTYARKLVSEGVGDPAHKKRFKKISVNTEKVLQEFTFAEPEKEISAPLDWDILEDNGLTYKMLFQSYKVVPRRYRGMEYAGKSAQAEDVHGLGIVDAIGVHNETEMKTVIDWKTGTYSDRKVASYNRQVSLYVGLLRILGHEVDMAGIYFLESGKFYSVRANDLSVEKVIQNFTAQTAKALAASRYRPKGLKDKYGGTCSNCNFQLKCRAAEIYNIKGNRASIVLVDD